MKTITIRESFLVALLKQEHGDGLNNQPGISMQSNPMEWVTTALAGMQEKLESELKWVEGTTLSSRACWTLKVSEIKSPDDLANRIGELEDSDHVSSRVFVELKEWLKNQPEGFGPTEQQQKEFDNLLPFITQALARNDVGLQELVKMDRRAVARLSGIGDKAMRYLLESGLLRKN